MARRFAGCHAPAMLLPASVVNNCSRFAVFGSNARGEREAGLGVIIRYRPNWNHSWMELQLLYEVYERLQ